MRKFGIRLLAAVAASSLIATPVFAAPSVDELKEDKAAAQSEVASLQEQLTVTIEKLDQLEADLIETGEKILGAQEDLEKAQEKADEQYESMKLRIRYMYENGQTDAVEALISSTDFSDFINKAEYISNVHTYDRQQLKALKDTEQEIQDLKTTLEEEQDRQEEMQVAYEEKEAELNATLIEKRAEIADFDQQIQAAAEAAARAAQAQEQQAGGGEDGQAAQTGGDGGQTQTGGTASTPSGGTSNGGTSNGGTSNGGTSGGSTGGSTSGGSTNSGTSAGNTSVAQTIVNAAYGQLGVPYVYGGSTPGAGLDCSGLVQYCHSVAGISLPRTSYEQGGCGVAVSNPQPGDIVCYGSHVGIYIGGGQMIHAPKPGDVVKVAAVYGSPWYRRCW